MNFKDYLQESQMSDVVDFGTLRFKVTIQNNDEDQEMSVDDLDINEAKKLIASTERAKIVDEDLQLLDPDGLADALKKATKKTWSFE